MVRSGWLATAWQGLEVETPSGEVLSVDDPALLRKLGEGLEGREPLTLLRSERATTDYRPVSLFSLQTARRFGEELGIDIDKRRFRANVSWISHPRSVSPKMGTLVVRCASARRQSSQFSNATRGAG